MFEFETLFFYLVLPSVFAFISLIFILRLNSKTAERVCVVVLGDFGRSPRMQYHSLSLANLGLEVDIVAYHGTLPHEAVLKNTKIHFHSLREAPKLPAGLARLYVPYVMFKAVFLAVQLVFQLTFVLPAYQWCLVQNPPTIPTLFISWFACKLRSSKLVIDWHNYGFSILALSRPPTHFIVRFAKWFEFTFGRLANNHFCVTESMRKDLRKWGIDAKTLYDKAPLMFKPTSLEDKHDLINRLEKQYSGLFTTPFEKAGNKNPTSTENGNLITTQNIETNKVSLKGTRPALLVSSTSWTEDEDFLILLTALEYYDAKATQKTSLPNVICMITGKGPQKEYYEKIIASKKWTSVRIKTLWLTAEDYPKLLGSCDLGVCLHKSSSGLDLPMKVVDMFGCGLPVCAVGFSCLHELVEHRKNGLVFKDSKELGEQLVTLLDGFPTNQETLAAMRRYILGVSTDKKISGNENGNESSVGTTNRNGWDENWQSVACSIFSEKKSK